jgi:hypothetical protein
MTYLPGESKVIYCSKDVKRGKVFEALKWLATLGFHVPDRGERTVRE